MAGPNSEGKKIGWRDGVHTLWTLYERYPAEHARRIASRLEFHHTPIHAS